MPQLEKLNILIWKEFWLDSLSNIHQRTGFFRFNCEGPLLPGFCFLVEALSWRNILQEAGLSSFFNSP